MDSRADISEAALDASPNERSVQIEAIGVYHLGPRGHRVVCKLLLRIRAMNRQGPMGRLRSRARKSDSSQAPALLVRRPLLPWQAAPRTALWLRLNARSMSFDLNETCKHPHFFPEARSEPWRSLYSELKTETSGEVRSVKLLILRASRWAEDTGRTVIAGVGT